MKEISETAEKMKFIKRIKNRLILECEKRRLWLIYRYKGKPYFRSYQWGKLFYSADGDLQEVFYHINGRGWYDSEYNTLKKWIDESSVVVDVGANMGFMTLIFSKLVGGSGKVVAFEPSREVFRKLSKNVSENRLENVVIKNQGCGADEKSLKLYRLSRSSGSASIVGSGGDSLCEDIEIVRLDSIAGDYGRIGFLKIDTEGFEDKVLEGALKILREHRPVVYIELSVEYKESSDKAIEILRENNYCFEKHFELKNVHNGDNFIAMPVEGRRVLVN